MTADGHLVNTHWGRPLQYGFHDTAGKHKDGASTPISQMTLAEVKYLQHSGGWWINSLAEDAAYAAAAGVTLCIEQKGDSRMKDPATWENAYATIQGAGAQAVVMSLPDLGQPSLALRAAGQAGFRTMLLTRGKVDARFFDEANLSAIKGPAARDADLKGHPGVVRLGTSSVSATRYGCSVGIGGTVAARKKVTAAGGSPVLYA